MILAPPAFKRPRPSPHLSKLIERVTLPLRNLSYHTKRIARAVRECRITRKLLVGEVWIIHQRSRWLHDIDPFRTISDSQSAPQIAASSVPVQYTQDKTFPSP